MELHTLNVPTGQSKRGFRCRDANGLSVIEVAEVLGLHPHTIRRHVWSGRIPAVKHGRRVVIPLDSVEFEIERRRRKGGSGSKIHRVDKETSATGADLRQQGIQRR